MKTDHYEIERRRKRRLYLRLKRMKPAKRKALAVRANRYLEVYSTVCLER